MFGWLELSCAATSACLGLLEILSVDAAGNTDIFSRMFVQDNVDDLWVRPDRVVRDLNDVPDKSLTPLRRQTSRDMAFDERHNDSPTMSI